MKTETIEYSHGGIALEGYAAHGGAGQGRRPGILVLPAWHGIDAYARKRAEMIAELGYVAFVADIYGKGVRPKERAEAAREAGKYRADRPLLRARAAAGLDALRTLPGVDAARLAAIGYCFGGQGALELVRSGADLLGVVSFHGALDTPTPEDARTIRARVLVLHGADDPHVPTDAVQAFQREMREGGVDWQMVLYGGAVHSFTDWNAGDDNAKGAAYNAKADSRSWVAMRDFFDEMFSP
ncbi:MAG: dienelactone hydrolase family protein [Magnetospirillum sp.]|nr:dienelactone hydrolase family protein [Magnetospirillum sp.]